MAKLKAGVLWMAFNLRWLWYKIKCSFNQRKPYAVGVNLLEIPITDISVVVHVRLKNIHSFRIQGKTYLPNTKFIRLLNFKDNECIKLELFGFKTIATYTFKLADIGAPILPPAFTGKDKLHHFQTEAGKKLLTAGIGDFCYIKPAPIMQVNDITLLDMRCEISIPCCTILTNNEPYWALKNQIELNNLHVHEQN